MIFGGIIVIMSELPHNDWYCKKCGHLELEYMAGPAVSCCSKCGNQSFTSKKPKAIGNE